MYHNFFGAKDLRVMLFHIICTGYLIGIDRYILFLKVFQQSFLPSYGYWWLFLGGKWYEADHLSEFSAGLRMCGALSLPLLHVFISCYLGRRKTLPFLYHDHFV